MLRYFFKINPDDLSDQEWARLVHDLAYVRNELKKDSEILKGLQL